MLLKWSLCFVCHSQAGLCGLCMAFGVQRVGQSTCMHTIRQQLTVICIVIIKQYCLLVSAAQHVSASTWRPSPSPSSLLHSLCPCATPREAGCTQLQRGAWLSGNIPQCNTAGIAHISLAEATLHASRQPPTGFIENSILARCNAQRCDSQLDTTQVRCPPHHGVQV